MDKQLTAVDFITEIGDDYGIFMNSGNGVRQMKYKDLKGHLTDNDDLILNELAFYMDINKGSSFSSNAASRVDVGGNMHMRQLWEDAGRSILMDANGNYCELSKLDSRYTTDGEYILTAEGALKSAFAHGDMMKIIPQTYGRLQTVGTGAGQFIRLWLSLAPLPGGFIIPRQVVGKFKCSISDSKLRSLPGVVTADTHTIKSFWDLAQARSTNHGLANMDFRNYLLFHMMSKYAWRDSQACKTGDNSLVWGVGLDGSESASDAFNRQKGIKTGATLALGDQDGKAEVLDSNSDTVHSVNVAGFENPWGQKWEMVQGLCSVGTDVYCWRSNFMPSENQPTAATFVDGEVQIVEHVKLTRSTRPSNTAPLPTAMNVVTDGILKGVYFVPETTNADIAYGDGWWYDASGQLWLFGGDSGNGANCGLVYAVSSDAWTNSAANRSARLAYYGSLNKVTTARFKQLA